jgi:hypothetical protein
LSGFCGGPFSPGSSAYTISNIGTNVFSWTASQTTNWLDFSATTGTLSPGQSNIVVVSVNTGNANQLAVGTYTNTLTFSSTLNTNVQLRTVILTVHGEISFSSASYSVLEGAGTALINVYRNGNTNRSVTVDFATSNGTATAGLDYISTNGTLTFAAGESEKTFGIEIIDDTLSIEPGESVLLALSNPTGDSTLEIPSSATLMILDNTVTNGLVLKYTFDPDTSPIATDGSPFGNNGSLTNASVVPGQSGNGVSFNGTNAYIEAPPSASLLPTEMTLAMWVKIPNIPTSDKTLIFKRNANIDFNEDYALEITPAGKARAVLGYGIGQTLLDSTSLVTGRWQHIAVTFSQPQFKIYVDGKLSGTATHNQPLQHNTNTYLFIGCRDHALYSKERFLSGVMDDVCIYNRALTAEEIALLVPKTYSLTVENGIGSGSYTNGTLVEIAADAPFAGMIFSQWSGAVQYVENVTASVTTVTMPGSNITVTATYTNLPGWYTLTVHNGSGSGLYSNGTAVVVTADNPSAGNVFDRWTGDTQYIDDATSPTAIVSIVSQDVTLTATYRTNLYTLVVENGSGDGSYAIGSVVPVSAEPIAGMVFTGWTTVPAAYTNRLANRLATSTTFTMPETNVVLTASYNSLTNGLVLKYTFDPDTSPVATDGSSYGNNGQLTNATIVTGQSGNCLSLNGSNAYIRTPSSASLMPTAITLSTWIKMASIPVADQTLIFKRNTNFNMNETFSLEITPEGKARIALSSSSGQSLLDSFALTTGRWQHIAVTFSQPQLAIYVDGKLQGTAYYNKALQNNSNSALFIGCRDHSSYPLSRFFDGVIDDICVYNRALSSNEIASLAIPTYLLTVENGTGYGTYTNGETVAVSAYAPAEGFVFSSWTTVPVTYTNRLANRLSASTTFTMPATNILLTANYRITNLYVDASRPDDAGAGTSWATAKKTIQAAINLATEGDTVWVTNGTYSIGTAMTPGGSLPNRIVATNDITICSVNGPDVTLIQGRGPVGTNAIRGAYLSGRSRLIGFTVESGATFSSDNATGFSSYGGGIYCYGGSTVSNCVVRDNASKNNGGGLYVNLNGNLVCNTTIVNNQTEYGGAGVGLGVGGNSIIRDCRIINNRAANKGGGVFIYHSGTLENCLIANNSATNSAGGVYTDYGSFGAYIKNCTISGNKAQSYGGLDYIISGATVYNSVIWGNTNGNWNGGSYTYCDTTPLPSGAGNLSTDPLFADADYRLGSGSPCINAGSNSYTSVTNDLDGNPRIIDGAVDIGAYEFYGEQEDYDGDGLPNRWEFLHFRTITGGRADAICSNGINTIRQAYIAGVNPNDPQSKFQVELVSERVLQWPSVSGRVYSVCFSTNLLNDFQPLFTNISWSVGCFTDLVHDADCQMFYKIDVQTE